MSITTSGLTFTWPVIVAFLVFEAVIYLGVVWLRSRDVQRRRAHYDDDYRGMLHAVQDIRVVLDDIRTNTEKK